MKFSAMMKLILNWHEGAALVGSLHYAKYKMNRAGMDILSEDKIYNNQNQPCFLLDGCRHGSLS